MSNIHRLPMRVSEEFLRDLDEWRRQETDLPSRAEAIRRLVAAGIAATRPAGDSKAGETG